MLIELIRRLRRWEAWKPGSLKAGMLKAERIKVNGSHDAPSFDNFLEHSCATVLHALCLRPATRLSAHFNPQSEICNPQSNTPQPAIPKERYA